MNKYKIGKYIVKADSIRTAVSIVQQIKDTSDDFDKDYARESQAVEKDVKKANEDYHRLGNKSASELFEMMGYKRDGHKYYKSNGSYTRVIVFNDFDDIKYYVLKDGVIPRGWTLTKTKWYDSIKDADEYMIEGNIVDKDDPMMTYQAYQNIARKYHLTIKNYTGDMLDLYGSKNDLQRYERDMHMSYSSIEKVHDSVKDGKYVSELKPGNVITKKDGSKWDVVLVRHTPFGIQVRMNSKTSPVKTEEITYRPTDMLVYDSVKDANYQLRYNNGAVADMSYLKLVKETPTQLVFKNLLYTHKDEKFIYVDKKTKVAAYSSGEKIGTMADAVEKTGDSIETGHEDERQTEMAIRFAVKEGKNQHGYYEYQGNADVAQVRRVLKRLGYYDEGYNKNPAGMMNRLTFYFADSVKDSRGSDIVSEVKRAYPGVGVSQIAENRSIKGENYRKTELTFDFKKIPDKFESANRMFSYIERKYSDEAQVFQKSDKTYVVTIFENLKKDSFQKDSVTVRDIIQSLVTEETSAIASYNVALETLKDHIPDEAYKAIKAIRDDEQRHVENLYAVLNGNVTPKNLEN